MYTSRWFASALVLAAHAIACASSPSQRSGMPTDPTHIELRERVVERGTLQVIVGVSAQPPASPESIRTAQDELITSLEDENVELAHRFEAIPFVVLRVDAAALDALLASPLVVSIEEDATVPPC